nr:hypothetical protein [Nostoc sp. DedQUE03]MDZ7972902.1 hypothetical protein [Nostoc sp. DedQUE03]MDZ8044239.1 hypothetical protein [Nostoc sp. DedQUE02]
MILSCSVLNPTYTAQAAVPLNTVYEQRSLHNLDSIGKYYMGREIAKVMGYTGAS